MMKTAPTIVLLLALNSGLFCQGIRSEKKTFGFVDGTASIPVGENERSLFEKRSRLIDSGNTIKIGIHGAVPGQVKRFLGFRWLPETMGLAEFYFYMFEKKFFFVLI